VYLKSLKLVGFKSFADRTRLELRPGVTVVVGPNGSGKSNLVDALSWVIGTQSTKALRTGKMEDVIFAGTTTRPALNRAEATLVIDNGERQIPLDLDEVSLTRRLYRDGSSDYEINGLSCRLLDIQDLLSDSGIGRHQHVIIGQGQIDNVLNASPEDHRAIIEEASGILKHRRRKEKTERRLERTDEDLVRLRDLLGEIERQMRPLKRQARAAERYDGLKDQVRHLTLYLSGLRLAELEAEMITSQRESDQLRSDLSGAETRMNAVSAGLASLKERAADFGAELDRDTGAAARIETTIERLRRIASVAHERSRAATGRREVAVARRSDLQEEERAIEAELASERAAEQEAALLAQSLEERFRRYEDEERAIATQASLSPEGVVAAVRGELSVLEAAESRDLREVESVGHRLDVLEAQLMEETSEISRINDEIRKIDERLSELHAVYESAKKRRFRDQEAWSAAETALATAELEKAASGASVDALTKAFEGPVDAEARLVVESADGALGSLVSLLDVPEGLERAVEAALGRWSDAVAFEDIDPLRSAVESVKSAGAGGIPIVSALGAIPPPAREVGASAGVEALVDLLGAGAEPGLATRLLGDVLVVEGWAAAWALISRSPALRAVTPEGDLITVNGVHIAHPAGVGPAMLEKAEIWLETAETELARASSRHVAAKRDFEKSRGDERAALEALETIEASLAGKTEAMSRLRSSADALEGERDRLMIRRSSVAEGRQERREQIEQLQRRLEALEGGEVERVRIWEEMESRRLELADAREEARSEWQEAAAVARASGERSRLLGERAERIGSELMRLGAGEAIKDEPGHLGDVEALSRSAVHILERRLEELRNRQSSLRETTAETVAQLNDVGTEREENQRWMLESRDRVGKLEVRMTELRFQRDSVVETVRRDADATPEQAVGAPRPDLPEGADPEQILAERSTQLRRLGPINPLAAAEYAEMSERHAFLDEQLADVGSSRAELRKVIAALETEIEVRFKDAFAEVAQAYRHYFEALFPGGRGRIRVIDPDDPQSGLSIDAQPFGKKVSQLSLLSGGERSLAALAFLFAIFEARPSPFYVLDEVEAALDDVNLRRFLRIVDEFRQRAQLIIVTHQQQTMEAADVLYGVTMEAGGSSQSVRKDMTAVRSGKVA
jgi:chromosome segregation protein